LIGGPINYLSALRA